MTRNLYGEYFMGYKASPYGIQNGYLDYQTLAKPLNMILCNDIEEYCEQLNGPIYIKKTGDFDIFQWYIIDGRSYRMLRDWTDECLFVATVGTLELYVWGVTHFGTAWDYILTNIKLNCGTEALRDENLQD